MVSEKLIEVLNHEGVFTIATQGENDIHLSCTWNSYVQVSDNGSLLYPAGGMNVTEANIKKNNKVQVAFGSKEVEGMRGPGAGFRIAGTAAFLKEGPDFDRMKQKFPWARAAVEIKIDTVTQTI